MVCDFREQVTRLISVCFLLLWSCLMTDPDEASCHGAALGRNPMTRNLGRPWANSSWETQALSLTACFQQPCEWAWNQIHPQQSLKVTLALEKCLDYHLVRDPNQSHWLKFWIVCHPNSMSPHKAWYSLFGHNHPISYETTQLYYPEATFLHLTNKIFVRIMLSGFLKSRLTVIYRIFLASMVIALKEEVC